MRPFPPAESGAAAWRGHLDSFGLGGPTVFRSVLSHRMLGSLIVDSSAQSDLQIALPEIDRVEKIGR